MAQLPTQVLRQAGLEITVELITPEIAKKYLATNTANRSTKDRHLAALRDDLDRGEFVLSGETIKFDKNGVLLDGQHRLMACIETGESFQTIVVRGLDPEVINVIDTGKARSPGDLLKIHGYKHAGIVSSVLSSLDWLRNSQPETSASFARRSTGNLDTRSALLDYLQANQQVLDTAAADFDPMSDSRVIRTSYAVATMAEFTLVQDRESAKEFWSGVMEGSGIDSEDPRWLLHRRLVDYALNAQLPPSYARSSKAPRRPEFMRLIVRAWNHWVLGHRIQLLVVGRGKSSQESVPPILRRDASLNEIRDAGMTGAWNHTAEERKAAKAKEAK